MRNKEKGEREKEIRKGKGKRYGKRKGEGGEGGKIQSSRRAMIPVFSYAAKLPKAC